MNKNDISVLRELAKQTMEAASADIQDERRALWRDFNSLKTYRVPVYVLDPQGMWREVFSEKELQCEDGFFRGYENWMRLQLYHATFGDDYIIEPWLTVGAEYADDTPDWWTWGVHIEVERINETMAFHMPDPPILTPGDIRKLAAPKGVIDWEATRRRQNMLEEAVGDIIPVVLDSYPPGVGGLSYILSYLLGPEKMLYQLYDQPEMVHEISAFISESSLKICDEADKQGMFSNCDSTFGGNPQIQAMPYCRELPEPGPRKAVPMNQHWMYDCSQEFESVGPEMYNEFVLSYQIPVYEKFGLTAYGCCENLTGKIPYLKKLKNLRRVAVTPWADDEACARQLEDKYVVSWRPNPSEMVMNGFDPERIKRIIRRAKKIYESYGCHWEINLKDFISVEHDRERLRNWVRAAREALEG
ncbi:MAG: hypothetical protein FWF44_07135 [Defluviitaleaceae bacterium]|nr:hypothetical protein [Defluviitaleaceae bacterium]